MPWCAADSDDHVNDPRCPGRSAEICTQQKSFFASREVEAYYSGVSLYHLVTTGMLD